MQVDLQFNVRTLIIEINYTLLLLFYIKTLFHSKLFCLTYMLAWVLQYDYNLFIIVLHKDILTCKHILFPLFKFYLFLFLVIMRTSKFLKNKKHYLAYKHVLFILHKTC